MSDIFYRIKKWKRERKFRKQIAVCGCRLNVFGEVSITGPQYITVGNDLRINEQCGLFGRCGSKITIGNDVTLSPGAIVLASGYDVPTWIATGKKEHLSLETVIGNHVWLCANSTVLGGVKITGEYVIIAAGAVVTTDITESYCLYAGVPARLVKRYNVEKKQISKCDIKHMTEDEKWT